MTRALLAAALLAAAHLAPAIAPVAASPAADQRVDLAHASWSLDGKPAPDVVVEPAMESPPDAPSPDVARLPCPRRDLRWTCEFTTDDAGTARLQLDWRPGPDGLLFELIVDGQRLTPPRDGWRPTARDLRSDLGSLWLGRGRHLLEVLPREAAPAGMLRLAALQLHRL